jgi:Protein of unknown function (DUF2778)
MAVGYSGQPPHKNFPADEGLEGLGPIPAGVWKMTAMVPESAKHGPDVIVLEPDEETRLRIVTLGRDPDSFRMHGERLNGPPGFASDGCIIMPRTVRMACWNSTDHDLTVMP